MIEPVLKRRFAGAARRMRFLFVRRPILNVDTAAIGLPPRKARAEVLVGVRDAAVMLLFGLILLRPGRGIAPQPELLDELLPFLIRGEIFEGGPLVVLNDVGDILSQPFAVGRLARCGGVLLRRGRVVLPCRKSNRGGSQENDGGEQRRR